MGFAPIHADYLVKTLDSSEIAHLGGYTVAEDRELKWIRLAVYKHGTAGGTEQMRLGLYSRSDLAGLLFRSDWIDVADFDGGTYWIGLVRFDFNRQHLDKDIEYHLGIETQNYTRNADTFYLSVVSDWPDSINTPQTGGAYFAAASDIFGYKVRT